MIAALLALASLLAPQERSGESMRWFVLDLDESAKSAITRSEDPGTKGRDWSFSLETLSESAREIGYAGEERGLLCHLLGVRPAAETGAAKTWAVSPELEFRVAGLGARIAGEKSYCRALLAPLPGKRWLLALAPAATLDEAALGKSLASPAARKTLASRLQNLLRDGHAARNSGKAKPPRPGYPGLGNNETLEIGDLESEESFALQAGPKSWRQIARLVDPLTGDAVIDDGIAMLPGDSLRFTVDLQSLISDDLILFGRSDDPRGKGEILVDGVPLGVWAPRPACLDAGEFWCEAVVRIPNRLLAGKDRGIFEIRPSENHSISVFRLQLLRLPPPHGEYLSDRAPKSGIARQDLAMSACPLVSGGYRFFRGLGAQAPSEIVYEVAASWKEMEAFVGIDDRSPSEGPIVFQIFVDGEMRAQSKPVKKGDPPQTLRASLEGGKEIRLVTLLKNSDADSKIYADWLEIRAFE